MHSLGISCWYLYVLTRTFTAVHTQHKLKLVVTELSAALMWKHSTNSNIKWILTGRVSVNSIQFLQHTNNLSLNILCYQLQFNYTQLIEKLGPQFPRPILLAIKELHTPPSSLKWQWSLLITNLPCTMYCFYNSSTHPTPVHILTVPILQRQPHIYQ